MSDKQDEALFLMVQPDTFTWPVDVRIPLNGRYGVVSFRAKFPNLTDDERDELVSSDEKGMPKYTNLQVAEKVLLKFADVAMPDGTKLEFTPDNKVALLAKPRVANAVVGTFLAVTRGMAAEKND